MSTLQTAQVANYDFGATAAAIVVGANASATIIFSGQPTSGQVIVIGTAEGAFTYEFNNGAPAAGHIAVAIGGADTNTAANLLAAIQANSLGLTAALVSLTITLTDAQPGTQGNSDTISSTASNVAITQFSGGVNDSSSCGVLVFSAKNGGKLRITALNILAGPNGIGIRPPSYTLTVSIQVSTDGVNWNATTNSNNGQAVTNVAIGSGQNQDFVVELRSGTDKFVRLNASGPGRGQLQIRSEQSVGLDIVEI